MKLKVSKACHFGRKPRRGGTPARERREIIRAVFLWGEREADTILVIGWDFMVEKVNMTRAVVLK